MRKRQCSPVAQNSLDTLSLEFVGSDQGIRSYDNKKSPGMNPGRRNERANRLQAIPILDTRVEVTER